MSCSTSLADLVARMPENSVAKLTDSQPRERESFPRLHAVMPVTKMVSQRRLQIVDGQLTAVVQLIAQ